MSERVLFELDKPDIEAQGVSTQGVTNLLSATENLFSWALNHRVASVDGIQLPAAVLLELFLAASPSQGSIVIPTWAAISAAAIASLGVAADVAQLTGYSVRDAIEALKPGNEDFHDETSREFARSQNGRQVAAQVYVAARGTGCTYVSITAGNQPAVVLVGQGEGAQALIASAPIYKPPEPDGRMEPVIERAPRALAEVVYHGKEYPAFVSDTRLPFETPGHNGLEYPVVYLWGSNKPIPDGHQRYKILYRIVEDPGVILHKADLPDLFRQAAVVVLVTGATVEDYS